MFDHRENPEILIFIINHPDDNDDGSRSRHTAGKTADGHKQSHDHRTVLLKAHDIAAAGKDLTENGTRQRVGHRYDTSIEILITDHSAVHKHSLCYGQVCVSTSEGKHGRQETISDISGNSRQGYDRRERENHRKQAPAYERDGQRLSCKSSLLGTFHECLHHTDDRQQNHQSHQKRLQHSRNEMSLAGTQEI